MPAINGIARTGIIRFNVKERGRKHVGQDRNFDAVAMANLINSPSVQERIANGDLHGFYGHWPREKFGMEPMEGGFIGGKRVDLEPSHRTIYAKAYPDGTFEHEEEFLDTAPGRLAARLHAAKVGGFSTAIVAPRRGAMQVPQSYHGCDFVREPNYTANRGYTLDGVELNDDDCIALDAVAEYNNLIESTNILLDGMQSDYELLEAAASNLAQENAALKSLLSRRGGKESDIKLDGVMEVVAHSRANRFEDADEFHDATLAGYQEAEKKEAPKRPPTAAEKFIHKAFNF